MTQKNPRDVIPGWSQFQDGNYTRAMLEPHINIMGDFFYAIWIFTILWALYTKNENFGATMIVGAVIAAGVQQIMPTQTYKIASTAILFGLTVIVYLFIMGRRG